MPDIENPFNSIGWEDFRKRDKKSVSKLKQLSPGQLRKKAGKPRGMGVEGNCRGVSKLKHIPACSPFAGVLQPWGYQI